MKPLRFPHQHTFTTPTPRQSRMVTKKKKKTQQASATPSGGTSYTFSAEHVLVFFALFDSLAILPLRSHVRLRPARWEGRVCPSAAAAPHQCCTSVLPTLSLSFPHSSPAIFIPQGLTKKNKKKNLTPKLVSHVRIHCECASLSF